VLLRDTSRKWQRFSKRDPDSASASETDPGSGSASETDLGSGGGLSATVFARSEMTKGKIRDGN
jgi:hypothetical protein